MDSKFNLAFNEYSNVSNKDLRQSLIEQENFLHELRIKPEENGEEIKLVLSNIEFIKRKIKENRKLNARITFDKTFRSVMLVILIVYCLSLVYVPLWMLFTSVKSVDDYYTGMLSLPKSFVFENFTLAIKKLNHITLPNSMGQYANFLDLTFNSFAYSIGVSFIGVALTTMMAYVLSKYKFFGSKFIYTVGIVVMIVPIVGSVASAMIVRKALYVYDNLFLTIITSASCAFSGLNFLLLYGAFKVLPWDYAEAVFVDGGGHYSAFFKMYLPMAFPTMLVIFVLSFLSSWNDYSTILVWLPHYPNFAYGLYLFNLNGMSSDFVDPPIIMAGFTIVIIPTVALYLASQKTILSKFTVGGLKG